MRLTSFAVSCLLACPVAAAQDDMIFDIIYMNHTNVVVAQGVITGETPDRFREFLATDPFDGYRYVVALDSPGGSLMGGMELGQLIREEGLNTVVERYQRNPETDEWEYSAAPGQCMSACALAFLGGERRSLDPDSELGFHQFSSAQGSMEPVESVMVTESMTQLIGATVLGYIMSMEVEPELYARSSEALPHEMWIPSADEAAALRIVTPTAFQDFAFEPYGNGVMAYSILPENVEGRSMVGQVTTYCKEGTPYLLLSGIEGGALPNSEWRSMIADEQQGFSLISEEGRGEVSYPPSQVSIRLAEELPIAEIEIDAAGVDLLSHPVLGRVEIGAVAGMYYFRTNPNDMDVAAIDAAFRLCIR